MAKQVINQADLPADWLKDVHEQRLEEIRQRVRKFVRWRAREKHRMKSTSPSWVSKPDWESE